MWTISISNKFTLKNFIEFEKTYIYPLSLHEDFYQKLIQRFSTYIPITITPNSLNEEDIYLVIDQKVNDKDFSESDTEGETYESIEKLNFPRTYED